MRLIPIQTRTSPSWPLVALKEVKVRVNGSASDAEQYERMQASCAALGRDFKPRIESVNLVPSADGFNFLGDRECAEIRAKPLLGLFLSPVFVAL